MELATFVLPSTHPTVKCLYQWQEHRHQYAEEREEDKILAAEGNLVTVVTPHPKGAQQRRSGEACGAEGDTEVGKIVRHRRYCKQPATLFPMDVPALRNGGRHNLALAGFGVPGNPI